MGDESGATPSAAKRITAYLASGGLFNPELANHDAVRDLLIDCRDELAALRAENAELRALVIACNKAALTSVALGPTCPTELMRGIPLKIEIENKRLWKKVEDANADLARQVQIAEEYRRDAERYRGLEAAAKVNYMADGKFWTFGFTLDGSMSFSAAIDAALAPEISFTPRYQAKQLPMVTKDTPRFPPGYTPLGSVLVAEVKDERSGIERRVMKFNRMLDDKSYRRENNDDRRTTIGTAAQRKERK